VLSLCACADLIPRSPTQWHGPASGCLAGAARSAKKHAITPSGILNQVPAGDSARGLFAGEAGGAHPNSLLGQAARGLWSLRGGSGAISHVHHGVTASGEASMMDRLWKDQHEAVGEASDLQDGGEPAGASHEKLAGPLPALQQPFEATPMHRPPGSSLTGRPMHGSSLARPAQLPQPPYSQYTPPLFHAPGPNSDDAAASWRNGLPPSAPSWQPGHSGYPPPPLPMIRSMHVTVPAGVGPGMFITVNIPGRGPASVQAAHRAPRSWQQARRPERAP